MSKKQRHAEKLEQRAKTRWVNKALGLGQRGPNRKMRRSGNLW